MFDTSEEDMIIWNCTCTIICKWNQNYVMIDRNEDTVTRQKLTEWDRYFICGRQVPTMFQTCTLKTSINKAIFIDE